MREGAKALRLARGCSLVAPLDRPPGLSVSLRLSLRVCPASRKPLHFAPSPQPGNVLSAPTHLFFYFLPHLAFTATVLFQPIGPALPAAACRNHLFRRLFSAPPSRLHRPDTPQLSVMSTMDYETEPRPYDGKSAPSPPCRPSYRDDAPLTRPCKQTSRATTSATAAALRATTAVSTTMPALAVPPPARATALTTGTAIIHRSARCNTC